MQVISVNIGKPQAIQWKGKSFTTSIIKDSVSVPCRVSFEGVEGDQQSNVKVHGGETKAVYAYDVSYYESWKKILTRNDWKYGMFGENLTTSGLLDNEVKIGDVFQIGTAIIKAMEPRFPCSMLNVKFGLSTMVKLFTQQRQNGIYFKVIQEGSIQTNDTIQLVENSANAITISDVVECYYSRGADKVLLHDILDIPYLPKKLRENLYAFL